MTTDTLSIITIIAILTVLLFWEHRKPFFGFYKKSPKSKLRHDSINLGIGIFNGLVVTLIFVSFWAWASLFAAQNNFGILNWLVPDGIFRFVLAVLFLDLWMYLWHWMNHKIPFFWYFHKLHHSDKQMDVTTASRFHIGEIVFSSLLRVPVILLIGLQLHELLIYEIMMFSVVQFHHADIRLSNRFENVLSKFIVTPNMHKVHHSAWQPETDSNYGSMFVFWDRIFKTFRWRDDPSKIVFGIDED